MQHMPNELNIHEIYRIINTGWEKCTPGHFYGPCIRGNYHVHYVISGKGTYKVGDKVFELTSGEGFIMYPDDFIYYVADKHDPWEYAYINFDGQAVEELMRTCGFMGNERTYVFRCNENEKMEKILREAASLFDEGKTTSELAAVGCFFSMLSVISNPQKKRAGNYVDKITDFIHNNFSSSITIVDVAAHVGLTRAHMYKVFKEKMGVSPHEYLQSYRIAMAKHLLRSTNLSVSEIACSCGFNSPSHFSYSFRHKEKIDPRSYRNN